MKRKYISAMACCLLCWACSTNPLEEMDDNDWKVPEENSNGEGENGNNSDTSGNLLDFDVSWDDVADNEFTDTETIPTDENDEEYDDFVENSSFTSKVTISYNGTSATVNGSVSGVTVTTDGAHVTVNSTAKGVEYVITGTTTDGSFKAYSEKKFKLTLNGVSLTSQQGAAINIQSGKRVFVETADGTTNQLTDASTYTNGVDGEDQKACFFSEGQLLFSGQGELTINGNYKHGICSDDYVYLHSGVKITVASAAKDAIHTNDKFIMNGGLLKLTPSSDGIDCEEGTIDIRGGLLKANITGAASKAVKAETDITLSGGQLILLTSGDAEYDSDDNDLSSSAGLKCGGNLTVSNASVAVKSTGAAGKGINCDGAFAASASTLKIITTGQQFVYGRLDSSAKGIKADGNLTIESGTIQVRTTGGEGSEGIESKSRLVINGGNVCVSAYDDCLNASNDITINGGSVYCYSSGNDGIDSNGTLTITGGTIVASGTMTPEEGIDCDQNTFKITGGTILGIGGSTSTPTSNVCTQRSVIYSGSGTSGSLVSILSTDGTHLMSYTIPRSYNQMTILYSSPSLSSDGNYTIYSGGSVSDGTSFYGLTTGGTFTDGTSVSSFTTSNMVTTVGSSNNGGGNPGGNPGGGPGGWGRP